MVRVYTICDEYDSAVRLGFTMLDRVSNTESYDNDIVIRWGNSSGLYNSDDELVDFKNVINPREAISLNCKKPVALEAMSHVVNTPQMWKAGSVVPSMRVVYRPIEHTGGSGFGVKRGPFKVRDYYYATQWLNSKTEIRVWFVGNKTMCGKRVALAKTKIRPKYPCRSLWGYKFIKNVPPHLHNETLKAAKAVGLEVGAADIIYYERKYYFLELNSAPTIDKKIIEEFYRSGFSVLLKDKFPGLTV